MRSPGQGGGWYRHAERTAEDITKGGGGVVSDIDSVIEKFDPPDRGPGRGGHLCGEGGIINIAGRRRGRAAGDDDARRGIRADDHQSGGAGDHVAVRVHDNGLHVVFTRRVRQPHCAAARELHPATFGEVGDRAQQRPRPATAVKALIEADLGRQLRESVQVEAEAHAVGHGQFLGLGGKEEEGAVVGIGRFDDAIENPLRRGGEPVGDGRAGAGLDDSGIGPPQHQIGRGHHLVVVAGARGPIELKIGRHADEADLGLPLGGGGRGEEENGGEQGKEFHLAPPSARTGCTFQ